MFAIAVLLALAALLYHPGQRPLLPHAILAPLQDAAHPAVFAGLTLLALRGHRSLPGWVAVLALGSEGLQLLTGRSATLFDVLLNLAGMATALAWHHRRRVDALAPWIRAAVVLLAIGWLATVARPLHWLVAGVQAWPELVRFDAPGRALVTGYDADLVYHAGDGPSGGHVRITPRGGNWRGVAIELAPNLAARPWRWLCLELSAAAGSTALIGLRIDDRRFGNRPLDRFSTALQARPEGGPVCIASASIVKPATGAVMPAESWSTLRLFTASDAGVEWFEVHRIHLVP